ncbi:MAG: type III pantothenate kinase [Woeseiaceae bacterium]
MTALLLDVGNSRIKWGLRDDGSIRRTGHISRERIREDGLQILSRKLPKRVSEILVSNVAGPSFATRLSGFLGMHCECDVHFARTQKAGWGLRNSYSQPRRMGVDRWVAMVGAWAEFQSACLVVDAGTALTLDAIDENGMHLGGQIIPGSRTMASALSSATSDIPVVRPLSAGSEAGMQMFGTSTTAAVREGAQNAIVGAIDRASRTLQASGFKATTVLTGGDASRILGSLATPPVHRPHLVLQGLAHMLDSAQ